MYTNTIPTCKIVSMYDIIQINVCIKYNTMLLARIANQIKKSYVCNKMLVDLIN